MVDPGLRLGMVEWVAGARAAPSSGIDAHILGQDGVWRHETIPPLARDRRVALLGLGELGLACALALLALGFDVAGWSRRPTDEPRPRDPVAGAEGLRGGARARRDPGPAAAGDARDRRTCWTPARWRSRRAASSVLNPGRGSLIDDAALLAALDAGRVGHATLDVFRDEPLPPDHPFWAHPRVTVTPHIASETRPATAAETIAENIRRGEAGLPFLHVVDRAQGY